MYFKSSNILLKKSLMLKNGITDPEDADYVWEEAIRDYYPTGSGTSILECTTDGKICDMVTHICGEEFKLNENDNDKRDIIVSGVVTTAAAGGGGDGNGDDRREKQEDDDDIQFSISLCVD